TPGFRSGIGAAVRYSSVGCRRRLDRLVQVRSGGKEEVEEGRWPVAARLQHCRLPAGDEQPLSGTEHFGLATERDLGRSRDLVEDAVGQRDTALLVRGKSDTHGFEMERHLR